MNKEDEVVGTIEDVVRDARLVDKGKEQLSRKFYSNAPSFDPDRRKFFKHAVVLAGLIASGKSCTTRVAGSMRKPPCKGAMGLPRVHLSRRAV